MSSALITDCDLSGDATRARSRSVLEQAPRSGQLEARRMAYLRVTAPWICPVSDAAARSSICSWGTVCGAGISEPGVAPGTGDLGPGRMGPTPAEPSRGSASVSVA